jgi:hypothetical protein
MLILSVRQDIFDLTGCALDFYLSCCCRLYFIFSANFVEECGHSVRICVIRSVFPHQFVNVLFMELSYIFLFERSSLLSQGHPLF